MLKLTIAALCLLFSAASSAHATCVAVAAGVVPSITFDPISQVLSDSNFSVEINTASCSDGRNPGGEIWFVDEVGTIADRGQLGGVYISLSYQGRNLLAQGTAIDPPAGVMISQQDGAQSFPVQLSLVRVVGSPLHSESREFSLYYRFADDGILNRISVPISLKLARSFELTAEASGSATLNLGEIQPGKTASVLIRARGTDKFRIEMQSAAGQVLRRGAGCGVIATRPDDLESISYSATIGGTQISSSSPYVDVSPREEDLFEKIIPLEIKIDQNLVIEEKRAGSYCDIIRLHIGSF